LVDRAVASARAALQGPWGQTSVDDRARLLHRVAHTGRPVEQALKMVLDKLGVTVIPQSFALGAAHQAFDSEGALVDDKAAQLVRSVGSSLARAASAYTAPAGNKQLAAA
jgi:hypothetical protein